MVSSLDDRINNRSEVLRLTFGDGFGKGKHLHVLSYCRNRSCKDPKDQVFGLLGLAPATLEMDINYGASIAKVYRDFAIAFMRDTQSLDILTHAIRQSGQVREPGWTSWVPNWRLDFDMAHYGPTSCHANGRANVYDSLHGSRADMHFRVDYDQSRSRLGLSSIIIDQVREDGSMWSRPSPEGLTLELFRQHMSAWQSLFKCSGDALWRLILRDAIPRINFEEQHAEPRLSKPDSDSLQRSEGDLLRVTPHFRHQVDAAALSCTPFKTTSGLLGQSCSGW
jgi:hypothetical protein